MKNQFNTKNSKLKTYKTEVIMKTLKLTMVATMVAFMMVGSANAQVMREKPKFHSVIITTVEKAIQNPGLETAMYAQLKINDFLMFHPVVWTTHVEYRKCTYRISGTREQWNKFFMKVGDSEGKSKYRPGGTN